MTEVTRRTPAASMNYLADKLEAALNADPQKVRFLATEVAIELRNVADHEAEADLTRLGDLLTAALRDEDVPGPIASRIWNRFFFGAPEGSGEGWLIHQASA